MPQEDITALERVYARWSDGDFATDEIFHPEVEVIWSAASPDTGGRTVGISAMGHSLARWFEGLSDVRFEVERIVDLGEQVLVVALMHARGRESGIDVTGRYGHLWTMRDGKAIRLEDADPDMNRPTS